ncbi:MAG: hypothetical protein PUB37_02380 [Firmicutes bacterium]|nr:hypothetical protein [Bacillota bacterium]
MTIKKIVALMLTTVIVLSAPVNVFASATVNESLLSESDAVTVQSEIRPVSITKQPENVTVEVGENAVFTVEATGTNLSYLWMRSKDGGKTWEKAFYSGYLTSEMTVPVKDWVYNYQFYCQITDKDKNVVTTDIVKAVRLTEGILLVNDESHLYSETANGVSLITRENFKSDSEIQTYNISYNLEAPINVNTTDMMILRFTAQGRDVCGHISVNINNGEYSGRFSLVTEKTEYYLSINGISKISSILISVDSESQIIDISDIELINYNDTPVAELKTGLFNINNTGVSTYYENDAIGGKATALLADEKYLYAVENGVLTIYLLADKNTPSVIGKLSGLGNTRDLDFTTDGNYLVINSRENGTYFVDIQNPKAPFIVSQYDTLEMATGLYVYGSYAFICSRYFGIEIVDISDIYNPKFAGQVSKLNEEFYDCCVSDGYLYVSVWAQMKVEVYSLSDVCNPELVSTILIDGECGGITAVNGVLYVVTGYHGRNSYANPASPGYGMGNGMEIYDVSDPSNPVWLSSSKIDGRYRNAAFDHWRIKTDGNYAYFTNIYNGIYIYDISNLRAPKRVDHIVIHIEKSSANYKKITQGTAILPYDTTAYAQGAVAGLTLIGGHLYFSDLSTGLYLYSNVNIGKELTDNGAVSGTQANITVPVVNGYDTVLYKTGSAVYDVAETKHFIYLGCADNEIQILDKDLNLINIVKTKGSVRDILIIDNILYSAENNKGLCVYKITDDKLEFITQYTTGLSNACFSCLEVNSSQDTLMVQAGWTRCALFDITDKETPVLIKIFTTGSMYYDNMASSMSNSDVLTYSDNAGLYCYSRGDDGNYSLSYSCKKNIISERNGIANFEHGILAIKDDGYIYFDPETIGTSDLSKLSVIKIKNKYLRGKPVIFDNTMVVSYGTSNQISVVDISDIDNPVLKAQFTVYGNPDVATITEDYILVPLRNGGLLKLTEA